MDDFGITSGSVEHTCSMNEIGSLPEGTLRQLLLAEVGNWKATESEYRDGRIPTLKSLKAALVDEIESEMGPRGNIAMTDPSQAGAAEALAALKFKLVATYKGESGTIKVWFREG